MKEYIDRDAAIHATDGELTVTGEKNMATVAEYITGVVERLKKLPAQPERKKGKWTRKASCEFCGFKPWYERDIHTLSFCPNCGADMRGEQDD